MTEHVLEVTIGCKGGHSAIFRLLLNAEDADAIATNARGVAVVVREVVSGVVGDVQQAFTGDLVAVSL